MNTSLQDEYRVKYLKKVIMTKIVTREDIVRQEQKLFDQGVNVYSLIERAGTGLARAVGSAESVTIMAGGGKNGADGVSAGLVLSDAGISVRIFVIGDKICQETKTLLREAESNGIEIREFDGEFICDEVVLDCLFGIGLNRKVEGIYLDAIDRINSSGAKIISADIPSGLDADTGKTHGACVKADITISFSGKKLGYFLQDGLDNVGEIVYADATQPNGSITLVDDVSFPKRARNTHKGSYGKVSIIAGCPKFVGASILSERSARACLRSGAGLVKLCVPYSMQTVYEQRVTESTLFYLPDTDGYILFDKLVLDEIIASSDVIAIGSGLGISEEVKKIVSYLAKNFDGTLIIDADGLNSISCDVSLLKGGKNVVLTPHKGEFARLIGKSIKDINDFVDGKSFAKEYGVTLHLKGASSLTFKPNGECALTCSGTPAMAKGGSGDVLVGIAAAFYGMNIPNAMEKASFIHGLAGAKAEKNFGSYGVIASDIVDEIPRVMMERIS